MLLNALSHASCQAINRNGYNYHIVDIYNKLTVQFLKKQLFILLTIANSNDLQPRDCKLPTLSFVVINGCAYKHIIVLTNKFEVSGSYL